MSYGVLTTIVVINALVTLWLWQKLSSKPYRPNRPRLNKKAVTALWRSEPIVPRHDPPKVAGGEFSSLVDDVDRLLFADFKDFADVVNRWLADDFTASRFRLQELPDGDVRLNVDASHGPVYGRCFAIYYNQTKLGRLEIHPMYGYNTEAQKVFTDIEINWARFVGYEELTDFLHAIAMHVASEADESAAAAQTTVHALTKTLWENYRISQYDNPDDEDWGELSLRFQGTAGFYMHRKDAPARKRAV
jgi:hypothetical protein